MSIYRYRVPKSTRWISCLWDSEFVRAHTRPQGPVLRKYTIDASRSYETGVRLQKALPSSIFSVAASDWLELRKPTWSPKMQVIEKTNIAHLAPEFGKHLLPDIEAKHVARYQQKRLSQSASPKTINLEIGSLRAIFRHHGLWADIQASVKMLPVQDDIGRALSADEESRLLGACAKSRSRSLSPFVVLAMETGARQGVLRTLEWKRVDFFKRRLQFGKDKTHSGSGRFVPLSPRAMASLEFWAGQFPTRQPDDYVFPSERYGASGFNFEACVYSTDPQKPMARFKASWEKAKQDAKIECRFHDLRHTAISRMIDAGVPLPVVAKIVGWVPATMVRMAARYGHFTLDSLRDAVGTISPQIGAGSPVNPPGANQTN